MAVRLKNLLQTAAVSLVTGCLIAGSASAMTLQEAIDLAIDTNPSVRASQAQFKSSFESADGVYAGFRPQVTLNANTDYVRANTPATRGRHSNTRNDSGYADVHQTDITFGVSKVIWDGGRIEGQYNAALEAAEGLRHTSYTTQQTVAQAAMQAYVDVYKQRQLVSILEAKLADHLRVRELAVQQAETGEGSTADVDIIDSRANAVETFLTLQRQQLRDAESRFILNVGEAPGDLVEPASPGDFEGLGLEELILLAFEEQPAIHASLAATRASRATLDASLPGYIPTFSVNLSAAREINSGEFRVSGTDAGDEKMTYTASLLMSLALYDGGAAISAKRSAMEGVEAATQQEAAARRTVENQVRTAYSAMLSAQQQTPLFQSNLDTQESNFENTQAAFENDEQSLLGVMDARGFVFDAEFQLLNAYYDEISARYRVLAAIGRLLDYAGVQ